MQQLDLFTKQPAKYKFCVTFYVNGRNITTYVEIEKNDMRDAIWKAKKQLKLKYYQQAAAFLMSSPPKKLKALHRIQTTKGFFC